MGRLARLAEHLGQGMSEARVLSGTLVMLSSLRLGRCPGCQKPYATGLEERDVLSCAACGYSGPWHPPRAVFPYRLHSGVYRGLRDDRHVIKIGQRGMADLGMVLIPKGRSGFLEMKSDAGRLTPMQKAWRDQVIRYGARWGCARSVTEAKVTVLGWLFEEAVC